MKVLCCGDRNWTDLPTILEALASLGEGAEIVHGACRGADDLCGYAARQLRMLEHRHPADWAKHGRAAGPIRNQAMLDQHHISQVFAFHDNLVTSKGTSDMVRRARAAGIPVRVFTTLAPVAAPGGAPQ